MKNDDFPLKNDDFIIEMTVADGLMEESVVDAALINSFKVRIRLGLFDPPEGMKRAFLLNEI